MENNSINIKVLGGLIVLLMLVFGSFIVMSEYRLAEGEKIFLDTRPVDPRDLLRGDYVILEYTIESDSQVTTYISENELDAGERVYLVLEKDQDDFGRLARISTSKPKEELFISAMVLERGWVDIGVDKFFVPEGRGLEIERLRGGADVLVSVGSSGSVAIVDVYHEGEKIEFKK